jgi:hypothetical protein
VIGAAGAAAAVEIEARNAIAAPDFTKGPNILDAPTVRRGKMVRIFLRVF